MILPHKEQLNKLTETIKKTQKFVNTFTTKITIDNEERKEDVQIKSLNSSSKKDSEFV